VIRRALTVVPLILLASVFSLAAQQSEIADESEAQQQKHEAQQVPNVAAFDERDAAEVLGTIRDGLESHTPSRFLSAFDADRMDGFLNFKDQVQAYFAQNQNIRVNFRIIQTSAENNRGFVLAEFQLESEPSRGGSFSRHHGQLRFELEPGKKGWKIVNLDPRSFFS